MSCYGQDSLPLEDTDLQGGLPFVELGHLLCRSTSYSLLTTALLAWWLRRPPPERKIHGSNPTCARIFSGSSHTSDLRISSPVATLPGAWRYRVSAGTGRPGVSIL